MTELLMMKDGPKAKVLIEWFENCLGTTPADPKLYEDYIASRAIKKGKKSEEEVAEEIKEAYEALDAVEQRGWTTFMRDKDGFFVYDYWVKGFLKSAFQVLMETKDIDKVTAYKNTIDRFVFIWPRKVRFQYDPSILISHNGTKRLPVYERPLRAMTPQGPRTALTRSDYFPPGTRMEFEIELLPTSKLNFDMIETAFSYGRKFGMSQWASGGWGRFEVLKFDLPAGKSAQKGKK